MTPKLPPLQPGTQHLMKIRVAPITKRELMQTKQGQSVKARKHIPITLGKAPWEEEVKSDG